MTAVLHLSDVRKAYGASRALDGVDLAIPANSYLNAQLLKHATRWLVLTHASAFCPWYATEERMKAAIKSPSLVALVLDRSTWQRRGAWSVNPMANSGGPATISSILASTQLPVLQSSCGD